MKLEASKDIVVAALITDQADRVLIVRPAQKEGWIFPGGFVEKGEAPSDACRREVAAELGVRIDGPKRLLSIDYKGRGEEYVMFIFDCGVFDDEMAHSITLPPSLVEYRFVQPDEAQQLLRRNSARRLLPTLAARNKTGIAYLEHEVLFE